MSKNGLEGTFALNKIEPIHRWYRYIEGYSSVLVEEELNRLKDTDIHTIFDPFAGTGTTLLSASFRGITPYYSETNPFMNFVVRTKINAVMSISGDRSRINKIIDFKEDIAGSRYLSRKHINEWDGFEKYYSAKNLSEIIKIKDLINGIDDIEVRDILMLALSAIAVDASKMIRRGDLRYAKDNEKKEISTKELFIEKLGEIIEDISEYGAEIKGKVIPLSSDCRTIDEENIIDCVITSPPYLNGTNYIRNTKLELKLNGFVREENDLAAFHSKGVVAGINNVSKRTIVNEEVPEAQKYVKKLNECAYDKRIPIMVNAYFVDMNRVFAKLSKIMRNEGIFVMDIGDSQFAGVHIPTDVILAKLCCNNGFELIDEQTIRQRYSKNGMELSQKLLRFTLKK